MYFGIVTLIAEFVAFEHVWAQSHASIFSKQVGTEVSHALHTI